MRGWRLPIPVVEIALSGATVARVQEIPVWKLRRRPRPPFHQLGLCLLRPLPELDGAQRWSALPDQTRQTLADLLTLLLIAHAGGPRQELAPEGDSDER